MKFQKVTSEYIKEKKSGIHNTGVFAAKFIPKGTKIIQYVGEKITKSESEKRADLVLEDSKKNKEKGAVYIFEINKKYDLDGNVPYNTARYINHSCNPNCESEDEDEEIWIKSIRDIKKGEELTYNYGYDIDNFEDHPCICGTENCVGYIADEKQWPKLKKQIRKNYKNKKVLIAYYSRTNHTKKVAKFLADYMGFDIDEIKTDDREGVGGYIKSAFESATNKKPRIKFTKNPEAYDLVIIGTPVWANTISSPMMTYLDICKNVKVAAFLTLGGKKYEKAIKYLSLKIPKFEGAMHLKTKNIADDKYQNKALEFFRKLKI